MSFAKLGMFFGIFLLVGVFASAFVSAGAVVLKTVPQQVNWKADGTTEYRMDVYADNTGLDGVGTAGIDWKLTVPQGLAPYITLTHAEWPTSNNFFAGYSTAFSQLNGWGPNTKVVWESGPSNRQGIVASYWFTINSAAPLGARSFDFDMGDTFVSDSSGNNEEFVVQNVPFTVVSGSKAMNSNSGSRLCFPGLC
jgi:hypothetical protein